MFAAPRALQTLVQRISCVVSAARSGPVHTPAAMLSTSPTRPGAVESVGSVFQRGAAIVTTGLRSERAETVPSGLVAVLTATTVAPTSAAASVYSLPFAPAIGRQP